MSIDGSRDQGTTPPPDKPRTTGRESGENLIALGRVWGVPVLLSPSWFIVAALLTITFAPVVTDRVPDIGVWAYPVAFVFAVLLYASVFVHELGHVVVARSFGLPVRRITLNLLGGLSEITEEPPTPAKEFAVSAIGPVVSLALGGAGVIALRTLSLDGIPEVLVFQLTVANLFVGVFNLLPGLPLDGGRVVRAGVWAVTGRASTGTKAAAWAGRVVALLVVALPFLVSLPSGGRPSLFSVVWAALIAAFVWAGSTQALRAVAIDERMPTIDPRRLSRRAVPVAAATPLALGLQQMAAAGARSMVVVDGDGKPIALVNESAVAAVPIERRPWVNVSSVARRLDPAAVLPFSLTGRALVERMAASPAGEYLVVDDDDRVYGVLTATDVEAVFGTKR